MIDVVLNILILCIYSFNNISTNNLIIFRKQKESFLRQRFFFFFSASLYVHKKIRESLRG
jgi:hypothetical protein